MFKKENDTPAMRCACNRTLFFKRIILIEFILLLSNSLSAQRTVWIPDTTVCQNVEFELPIFLSGFGENDSLIAYQIRLDFDPEFIHILNVSNLGTWTESWEEPYFFISDTSVFIAGFSAYPKGFTEWSVLPSLVEIDLSIQQDSSCSTTLRLANVQFFNLEGLLSVDSLKGSHIDVVYNIPPFISGFPDTTFFEDTSLKLSLLRYIHDLNNPIDDLQIDIHVPDPIALYMDTSSWTIEIRSPENWTGSFGVDVTVTDLFSTSATDHFCIITLPVVDPPEPFHLFSPAMDSTFFHFDSFITFRWTESVNLDTGDVITYRFFLSSDSTFKSDKTIQMANISQSMLSIKPLFPSGIYYWGVRAEDRQGLQRWCDDIFRLGVLTGISDFPTVPSKCILSSPYPNPFNSQTLIRYALDASMPLSLKVFDVRGREARILYHDVQRQGRHTIFWDGRNDQGSILPSGTYFIKMETETFRTTRKVVIVR